MCSSFAGACSAAGALFQSREYAEYQDQRGYNAEHDAAASTQPWHGKEGFALARHPAPGRSRDDTNDGGGIAQIFAAHHPQCVRSLALTNCDAHDNWPPEAFKPFLEMAAAGGLPNTLRAFVGDKNIYRSPQALGPAYEHPERVTDETIDFYLKPHLRTAQRTRDLERFLAAFDPSHTVAVEAQLKKLRVPTLIVWGTSDIYFDVKWADWLAATIPGTRRNIRIRARADLLPRRAMGGIQPGTADPLVCLRSRTMSAQVAKAETFRSLHVPGRPLVLFNIWDAGTAKVVASEGARALATGSWSVAAANGFSDGERLPLDLAIDNLARIVRATDLPVTVDLESGYGEIAAEVAQSVARAIEAGAVGCNLEDSFPRDGSLRDIDQQAERIAGARRAASNAGVAVFINARTDVFFQKPAQAHDEASRVGSRRGPGFE